MNKINMMNMQRVTHMNTLRIITIVLAVSLSGSVFGVNEAVVQAQTTTMVTTTGTTATTIAPEVDVAKEPARGYAKFTNLGTMCGQTDYLVEPHKINDAGQIVGIARGCDGKHMRAFLWSNGKMKDLGALYRDDASSAVDINKKGQIIGYSESEEDGSKMFMYQNGRMKKYKADIYRAFAINDAGVIAGQYFGGGEKINGFILTKGITKTYPYSFLDINNSGQAVGVDNNNFGPEYAVLWQNGKATKLGVLPGDSMSAPSAINNNGAIVGYSSRWPNTHTFMWKNGVLSQINFPRSYYNPDINDHEQIVSGRYLYHNGEVIDLNDLLPSDSKWKIFEAKSINNNGQIIGRAWNKNGGLGVIGFLLDLPDEYKF